MGIEFEMGMSIDFSGKMDFCVFLCVCGEMRWCGES